MQVTTGQAKDGGGGGAGKLKKSNTVKQNVIQDTLNNLVIMYYTLTVPNIMANATNISQKAKFNEIILQFSEAVFKEKHSV